MTLIQTDYATASVNACSAELIKKIHTELLAQPLGSALVIGKELAFLIPLPSQSISITAISTINMRFINDKRLPPLYELDYLVRDDLSDEDCLVMAENLKDFKFIQIPHWKGWIIDHLQEMDEAEKLSSVVALFDSGDQHSFEDFMLAIRDEKSAE